MAGRAGQPAVLLSVNNRIDIRLLVAWKLNHFQIIQALVLDNRLYSYALKNLIVRTAVIQIGQDLLNGSVRIIDFCRIITMFLVVVL